MGNSQTEVAVERACNLVNQPDPADIRQAWQDLRRSHCAARRNGCELPAFPDWVLTEQIPAEALQLMLEAEYGEGARRLGKRPVVCRNFGVPAWHFALFLGDIGHRMAGELSRVSKEKPDNVSFESFYRELKRIRDRRLNNRTPSLSDSNLRLVKTENALGFKPSDLKTYC